MNCGALLAFCHAQSLSFQRIAKPMSRLRRPRELRRLAANCNLQQMRTDRRGLFRYIDFIACKACDVGDLSGPRQENKSEKDRSVCRCRRTRLGFAAAAEAHVSVGIGIGIPIAPAYPVYAAPPPVYYAPPPPPVVYAPGYYAPPAVVVGGYYGGYGRPYYHHGYYRGYYGHGYYRR
jgi:hypothetical protein